MDQEERLQYAVLMVEGLADEDFAILHLGSYYTLQQRLELQQTAREGVRLRRAVDKRMADYRASNKDKT